MSGKEELDQIKGQIQQHLITSGNYDLINKQLKLHLYESGWYDKVAQLANKELQENSQSQRELSFEQLFAFVKPRANELIPDKVKEDTIEKIKEYLDQIIE